MRLCRRPGPALAAGLLAGTSFGGGALPTAEVIEHSDFLLIHGNGVKGPDAMRKFIAKVKKARGDRQIPIVVNEDDHFDFDQADNNFTAAVNTDISLDYLSKFGPTNIENYVACVDIPVSSDMSTTGTTP